MRLPDGAVVVVLEPDSLLRRLFDRVERQYRVTTERIDAQAVALPEAVLREAMWAAWVAEESLADRRLRELDALGYVYR